MTENVEKERKLEYEVAEFLGLHVDAGGWVQEYHGFPTPKGPSGWQIVCHISKLKLHLLGQMHPEHKKRILENN